MNLRLSVFESSRQLLEYTECSVVAWGTETSIGELIPRGHEFQYFSFKWFRVGYFHFISFSDS